VLKVLLVDDDRNLATTLSDGLRKALGSAISVVVCFSGSEAQALFATQPFDLVISDFNMPGMSGLELLKKIRQDHLETSLILITAYGTDALIEEVHQLGITYIAKPFELPFFVQLILDLVQSKEKRSEIEKVPRILRSDGNADPAVF